MKNISRIFSVLLALIITLNSGFVFAADSTSYDAGYKAGYDLGAENADNDLSGKKVYEDYYESKEYYNLTDGIDDFIELVFREGFIKGFRDGVEQNQTVNYASELGSSLGEIYGARDYQKGDKSDWEDALPSDRDLRDMYDLNKQDSSYRNAFIDEFTAAFKEGYLKGYDEAMFEPAKVTLDQGVADGEEIGAIFGTAFGSKDFYEGRDKDHTRNLPSDKVITSEYSLNNDSDEYKDGFLSGFIRAYEEAYNEAYRRANMNDTLRNESSAYSDGQGIGKTAGEMQATNDYMMKLNNDWKRSIPSYSFIANEYNLNIQTANYRDAFISGYYDGYSEGYNGKFKELSLGAGNEKLISQIVPISGGSVNSPDGSFSVTVEPGTYYHDVNFTINANYDVSNVKYVNLIKASDSYNISLVNSSGNLDDSKSIEISIEYYGDSMRGGVYRLDGYSWLYIPTEIVDGMMIAKIDPSTLSASGNTYSAFVDPNAIIFPDSRGHWAMEEINTYVRRNVIYGYSDMTFKPDRNISRAEFLTILSRAFNWNTVLYTGSNLSFKDAHTFGNFNNIINYATNNNYIYGYTDGTFRPNNPISYSEVEIIINRVLESSNFKWSNIATDMLYDKKISCNSFKSMNNKITRAEIVYMLSEVVE